MNRIVGMKNYGPEWFTTFGLDYDEAADLLTRQGVNMIVIQNLITPLPTSAVEQEVTAEQKQRFARYRDEAFRESLRAKDIKFYEAVAMFFDPQIYAARPDCRPVGADGRVMEMYGWYVGLCPTNQEYLKERIAKVEQVVEHHQPDGLFLGWIRYPAFWELWMPETARADIPEYCFCDRCLERFQADTGLIVPDSPRTEQAAFIQRVFRSEWTRWKCQVIADVVGQVKRAAQRYRPEISIMINTLPFMRRDYENVMEDVTAQRFELLASHADVFELMLYHQILRREPVEFTKTAMEEAEARTTRTLLATLQTKPDYLQDLYAAGRRKAEIPFEEHLATLRAVADSPADGVMVYHWKDYLEAEARGDQRMSRALRAFKDGEL
ncbi:MAG: hypothetical protein GY801_04900 [bacterium]|nr:hypothetical protein [bacterium]